MKYTVIFLIVQVLVFTSIAEAVTFSSGLLTVTSLALGKILWNIVEE